jgi:DNA adenine methylase
MGYSLIFVSKHECYVEVFKAFHVETVDIKYIVGGGKATPRKELTIFSWDDAARPAGLF